MNLLTEEIAKKHAFVYRIDEEYYFLGQFTFQKGITQLAYDYYAKLRILITEIGIDNIRKQSLSNESMSGLLWAYKRVLGQSDLVPLEENNYKDRIDALISTLTDEQYRNLESQVQLFSAIYKIKYDVEGR